MNYLNALLGCALLAGWQGARAQHWAPLDKGMRFPGQINVLYADTIWDRLLAGGTFRWMHQGADTVVVMAAAQWNGTEWDSLPAPHEAISGGNIAGPVYEFYRWRDDLYVVGSFAFELSDGTYTWNFVRWNADSLAFEGLECVNHPQDGMYAMVPSPPQDTAYFTGYRGTLCGHPWSNAFQYDGTSITPFAPMTDFPGSINDYVGYVFRYQNQLYMTGSLHDTINGNFYTFMRYTGTEWEGVPGWNTLDAIKDVVFVNGKIFVCGVFFTSQGAPGNMVASFDGQQWDDLGGGILEAWPNGTLGDVIDLHVWNGDVYAAGLFNYAGGVPAKNVARWNGSQWCGMGGTYANQGPGGRASTLTVWRDSLYMAGGFITIDGDTLYNVAKWLGNVGNCSPPVGVEEHADERNELVVWPNPVLEVLHLNNPQLAYATITDATGRHVMAVRVPVQGTVPVAALASGCYMLHLRSAQQQPLGVVRFAKE